MRTIAFTVALLLIGYHVFVSYGPRTAGAALPDQYMNNRRTVERFMAAPAPVVIVGSSLTRAIAFDDLGGKVYNLAVAGESSLTGLAIIAQRNPAPRCVYVEINVMKPAVNSELVADAASIWPRLSPIFYAENMPINLAYSFLYQFKRSSADAAPADALFKNAVQVQRSSYARPWRDDLLAQGIGNLKSLVTQLEREGTRVVFFELPIYADLGTLPLPKQVRSATRAAFPRNRFVAPEQLADGHTIRTVDGVHLDPEEGRRIGARLLRDVPGAGCFEGDTSNMRVQPLPIVIKQ